MRSILEELNAARTECLSFMSGSAAAYNQVSDTFDHLIAACKTLCDESDAKHAEECKRLQECTREQYQNHIYDLMEELANCREDAAADRQTIQHLVAVVAKLVK